MIPRLKPLLGVREFAAAIRPPGRSDVARFEAEFARALEQSHAISFPYGRTGLMLLLEAMGLRDQEIICPAYTCVVVPHAVVFSGNKPVFVDSEPGGFNMDLQRAAEAITPRTGAIIVTSLFGYPVDLDVLAEFRRRYPGVKIIQDCAHSFGARWRGAPVQKAGDAAIYGLNVSKIVTSIFGGMVTTDDSDLAFQLKLQREKRTAPPPRTKSLKRLAYLFASSVAFRPLPYAAVNRLERLGALDRFTRYYDEAAVDMPRDHLEGLTPLEARVGTANLSRYQSLLANRLEAAEHYFESLDGIPGFELPPRVSGATYSHFVVRVPDREAWLQAALQKGIQLGQLIEYNIPELSAYSAGVRPADHPVASGLARTTINLPVWGGRSVAEKVARFVQDTAAGISRSGGGTATVPAAR